MKKRNTVKYDKELTDLCNHVKSLVLEKKYETCIELICGAMSKYPHAPHPHNLLGIVLEKRGEHVAAMRHFQAAWALDSTYLPARYNLETYGSFFSQGSSAYVESDVRVKYDNKGISHLELR